jgi:hypothetical protein
MVSAAAMLGKTDLYGVATRQSGRHRASMRRISSNVITDDASMGL